MTIALSQPPSSRVREMPRFEALVRSQTPRLWPIAHALTGEREAACSLLKLCFAELEPRLAGMRSAELADWLRRQVILNGLQLLDERTQGREPKIETLLPRFDTRGRRTRRSTDQAGPVDAAHDTRRRCYREGLERLPRAYRDVVLLRDVLKLAPDKTADLLGLTRGLLSYRLHHGRLALLQHLFPAR